LRATGAANHGPWCCHQHSMHYRRCSRLCYMWRSALLHAVIYDGASSCGWCYKRHVTCGGQRYCHWISVMLLAKGGCAANISNMLQEAVDDVVVRGERCYQPETRCCRWRSMILRRWGVSLELLAIVMVVVVVAEVCDQGRHGRNGACFVSTLSFSWLSWWDEKKNQEVH
jgi:hypothetical protein